jgi:very-short-patch-repair endonuclease
MPAMNPKSLRARIRSTASAAPKATAKPKAAPKLSAEQMLLIEQLRGKGYAALPEVRFHPERKWRIDVAVAYAAADVNRVPLCIAIEINGGAWSRGRHVRGAGYVKDMEKLNMLTELGWRVLQFTPQQVRDGSALAQIERCL